MKRAIFPGTFDPFTLGHFDILKRSKLLFDEIIVGIGKNSDKKTMFSLKERLEFIERVVKDDTNIKVMSYDGLTIDFCEMVDATFIVRGVRNTGDFEFEKAIARTNRFLSRIETIFILTSAKTSFISSSIVRDLINNGGDYSRLVPESIYDCLLYTSDAADES